MKKKINSAHITRAIMVRVLRLAYPHKVPFLIAIIVGLSLALLSPVKPWIVMYTVDHYIKEEILSMLIYSCIALILVSMVEMIFRFAFEYTAAWMGQHIIRRLREQVFAKILRLKLRQFDKTPLGVFSSRSIDDTERINDIFSGGLLPVIVDIVALGSVLAYMFWLNVTLTLLCLAPTPILLLATWFFKEQVNKYFHHVRNAVANLNALVSEHLASIHIIQAFSAENRSLHSFKIKNKEHRQKNQKAIFAYSIFFPIVELVSALSIGFMVWWAAGESIPTGHIVSFILCINALFRPLRFIADKFNTIQMGLQAAKRVFGLLDNTDIVEGGSFVPSQPLSGNILFKNVRISYNNNNVLNNFSLSIAPRETIGIVGRTGSGKSSIISLINRQYEHQEGNILIDNTEIEKYDLAFLRTQIGFVSQTVFLFGGSLYENIVFASPQTTNRRQVKQICKDLGINSFVQSLPGGYDFQLNEGGSNLSSGQRQLISLARVFVIRPPIIIMDEATASIDKKVESIVDFAIEKLLQERTAVIVAHRHNTLKKVSRILEIDRGAVVRQGTYQEFFG